MIAKMDLLEDTSVMLIDPVHGWLPYDVLSGSTNAKNKSCWSWFQALCSNRVRVWSSIWNSRWSLEYNVLLSRGKNLSSFTLKSPNGIRESLIDKNAQLWLDPGFDRNLRNNDKVAVRSQLVEGLVCSRNWNDSTIEVLRIKESVNAIIGCSS